MIKILNNLINKLTRKNAFGLILAVFVLAAFTILGLTAVNLMSQQSTIYIDNLNYIKTYYSAIAAKNFAYEYYLPFRYNFSDVSNGEAFTKMLSTGTFSMFFSNKAGGTEPRSIGMQFRGSGPSNTTLDLYQDFAMDGSFGLVTPKLFRDFRQYAAFFDTTMDVNTYFMLYPYDAHAYNRFLGNIYISAPGKTVTLTDEGNNDYQVMIGSIGNPQSIYTKGNLQINTVTLDLPCDNGSIFGAAYAGGSITNNPPGNNEVCQGSVTGYTPPDGWPEKPAIKTTYFDKLIQVAVQKGQSPLTLGNTVLNGTNIFVNGDVSINAGAAITGPGSIISSGTITINPRAKIGERIRLIANTVTIFESDNAGDFTIIGGNKPAGANVIEGTGVLIYANSVNIGLEVGGCCCSPTWSERAINTLVKGVILAEGVTHDACEGDNVINFGITYVTTGLSNQGNAQFYGNLFTPITTGVHLRQVRNYQNIAYPAVPGPITREEIPLGIKGLYQISSSALRITP